MDTRRENYGNNERVNINASFLQSPHVNDVIYYNSFCHACKKKEINHNLLGERHAVNLLEYLCIKLGITNLNEEQKIIQQLKEHLREKNEISSSQPQSSSEVPTNEVSTVNKTDPNPTHLVRGIRMVPFSKKIKKYFCGVCSSTGLIWDLRLHVESCFPEGSDLRDVFTEVCHECSLQIVRKTETNHFKSSKHKKNVDEQHMLIENEVSCFIEQRVIYVIGFKKDVEHKELFSFFSQFGAIASLTVDNYQKVAVLRFWEQGSGISKVLAAQPFTFNNDHLYCVESKLKIFDNYVLNVALDDDIVRYLLDPIKLNSYCLELGKAALDLMNDPKEIAREDELFKRIDKLFETHNLNWRVFGFGSRITGLSLDKNSDVDIFVGTASTFFGESEQDAEDQSKIVNEVSSWLQDNNEFTDIETFPNSRIPIVRLKHVPTGLPCDLSFKNGLSVRNTVFIRKMLELDERVRPMVLFLKQWAVKNQLKYKITSYCLTMMIFYYLAQLRVPVLPTLASLRHRYTEDYVIAGWDASFKFGEWKSSNKSTIPELLAGFFYFYANFDYKNYIICLENCTAFPRADLMKRHALPRSVSRQWDCIPFEKYYRSMCIMDPFDFSHNLTVRIRKWTYLGIIDLFKQTFEILDGSLVRMPSTVSQES